MSKNSGKSEMRQAIKLMRDNVARLEAIGIPTIEAQKIALESPELVGLLEAEILEPSRFEEISMDPRLQAAQMAALEDISGIAEAGGLDATARLNLEQGLGRIAGAEQARLQQLREDPTLGQGQKLALQAQAVQGAGQSGRDIALQAAAQAQQARMAALGQQANLASGMQQQQLGLAGQKASAADAIAQFNAQNRQNVAGRNLSERQRIAEAGAATRNQQDIYNKGLIQQQFQNQMAKVAGITGQQANLAGNLQQQAAAAQQAQQAMTGSIIGAGATLGGAYLAGPAGAAVGSTVASSVAPKANTYAVNWQPGKNPYENIG